MVHLRCLLLLLGLFFVVLMHDLGYHSSAYAHNQGKGIKEEEYGSVFGGNFLPDRKELILEGISNRKMLVELKEVKDEGASPSSTISTEKKTLGKVQDQDHFNHQKKSSISGVNNENDQSEEHNDEEIRRELSELVSMMRKDYSRFGRRKPPINNHEPRH